MRHMGTVASAFQPSAARRGTLILLMCLPAPTSELLFEGYTGRYVWHCHILEPADNETMRRLDVVRSNGEVAKYVCRLPHFEGSLANRAESAYNLCRIPNLSDAN